MIVTNIAALLSKLMFIHGQAEIEIPTHQQHYDYRKRRPDNNSRRLVVVFQFTGLAANIIAPAAPRDAAAVGLVIPPRIEPNTATIKITGGETTRNASISINLGIALFKP